ncbi:MAG: hypothetical protein ACM3PC_05950, partial [Deltaproteobacteria bacterium]
SSEAMAYSTSIDDSGHRLIGTTRFLGAPSASQPPAVPSALGPPASLDRTLHGAERSSALDLPDPGAVLAALPISMSERIVLARLLIEAFKFTHRYETAARLATTLVAMLQRTGNQALDPAAVSFFHEATSAACGGLADAMSNLSRAPAARCPREHARLARPVLGWAVVLTALPDDYLPASCPGFTDGGWKSVVDGSAQSAIQRIGAGASVDLQRCECDETPSAEWTARQQASCPLLQGAGAARSALQRPSPVPVDPRQWDLLKDSTAAAYYRGDVLSALELPDAAADQKTQVAEPFYAMIRDMAYASCADLGKQTFTGKLSEALERSELRDDAQACGNSPAIEARAANGNVETRWTMPGGTSPGAAVVSGAVEAGSDGLIHLAGAIPALHCPADDRVEADDLVVRAAINGAEIARQRAGASGNLLAPEIAVAYSTLATRSGLPGDAATAELELWREGPGCDGIYGSSPVRLFTLTVHRPVSRPSAGTYTGTVTLKRTMVSGATVKWVISCPDGGGQCTYAESPPREETLTLDLVLQANIFNGVLTSLVATGNSSGTYWLTPRNKWYSDGGFFSDRPKDVSWAQEPISHGSFAFQIQGSSAVPSFSFVVMRGHTLYRLCEVSQWNTCGNFPAFDEDGDYFHVVAQTEPDINFSSSGYSFPTTTLDEHLNVSAGSATYTSGQWKEEITWTKFTKN